MANLDYEYLAKLVVKAQENDSNAFAELYTATYQKQYRFTYQYVKNAYLAQDILQEVYILVLKNLKALKNPRLFVSWLNQINFRVCVDVYNKEIHHSQPTELTQSMQMNSASASDISPEEHFQDKARQAELMKHILSLHPQEAQVIIMKFYNDMTIEEIADAMDCSRSTVKRRLANGKTNLKALLRNSEGGINID